MGNLTYKCGCSVTKSMFGNREVIGIIFCLKHYRLIYSQDKTNGQMAKELDELL